MDRDDYLNNVGDLTPEQIADGIIAGIVTFEALQETGNFLAWKQKKVKEILAEHKALTESNTVEQLKEFLRKYSNSIWLQEAKNKLTQKEYEENEEKRRKEIEATEEQQRKLDEIKRNINDYTPQQIITRIDENKLIEICINLNIDYKIVREFQEPSLYFNDIPQDEEDIPSGYTDVFFWGIPSSGKTCALSAIFNTINVCYTMTEPETKKKFGSTYRDSLVNIFENENGIGYLPDSTRTDRTQYMPFLLKKRKEKKYRKISFFELNGEVFKYFYEKVKNKSVLLDEVRQGVEDSFRTLEILLNSKNQKIHFFFIDYNQQTRNIKDKFGLTQRHYLDAAAVYFHDHNDIFKRKTDAVYVFVTKADEIQGDKKESAINFLSENFGSFMDMLKHRCEKDSISFDVKLFSIGEVYFKRICKINRDYAKDIIEDLLGRVQPESDNIICNFLRR